jgi:RimJ/RimL family protein N-acetyltransferase
VLRFDRRDAPAEFEVSIAVAPERQGMGIGAAALALAQAAMPGACLVAEVDAANPVSGRLFRSARFRPVDARQLAWNARPVASVRSPSALAESIAP